MLKKKFKATCLLPTLFIFQSGHVFGALYLSVDFETQELSLVGDGGTGYVGQTHGDILWQDELFRDIDSANSSYFIDNFGVISTELDVYRGDLSLWFSDAAVGIHLDFGGPLSGGWNAILTLNTVYDFSMISLSEKYRLESLDGTSLQLATSPDIHASLDSYDFSSIDVTTSGTPIPEPSSTLLFGLASLLFSCARRRHKRKKS